MSSVQEIEAALPKLSRAEIEEVRAFSREFQGDGAPDAAARAGDDRNLIGKLAHKLRWFAATDETEIRHRFKAANSSSVFHL